jgi:hypothetical protein
MIGGSMHYPRFKLKVGSCVREHVRNNKKSLMWQILTA